MLRTECNNERKEFIRVTGTKEVIGHPVTFIITWPFCFFAGFRPSKLQQYPRSHSNFVLE